MSIPVFLGNAAGGAIFVSLIYFVAYKKDDSKHKGILVEKDKVKTG